MLVTLFGRITLVKSAQSRKASLPILVTPSGTSTSPPGPTYFFNMPFSITKSFGLLIFFFFLSSVDGSVIIPGAFPQLVYKLFSLLCKRPDLVVLQLLFQ